MTATQIAALNDAFRTTFTGGRVVTTVSVAALPEDIKAEALKRVRSFNAFSEDNDPHHEHDFGSFELEGHTFFFKIDYYDLAMQYGSENPADPSKTTRVLTIMLAEDY